MSKNKKIINIDVSELPINEKKEVVKELTDIYTKEDLRTHTDYRHIKFVVPVGNKSPEDVKKQLKELMSKYNEVVDWDETNELFLPDNVEYNKDIWYPIREDNNTDKYCHISSHNSSTCEKFIVPVGDIKKDNFFKRLFKRNKMK